MNRTHFEHAAYAVLMQIAVGLLAGSWVAGAAFGAAFFIGREHAQAEARVGSWAKYPEFECLMSWRYWSLDSMLDWICPLLSTMVMAIILGAPWLPLAQ